MMRSRISAGLAALAIPLALAACDTVQGTFNAITGGGRQPSDGSLTASDDSVRRPPLTLPPDYNLRPPSASSANSATDFSAAQQARQTVFGIDDPKPGTQRSGGSSSGESALLQRAGANSKQANVRQQVDRETTTLKSQENNFANNLLNPPEANGEKSDGGWLSSIFGSDKPTIER